MLVIYFEAKGMDQMQPQLGGPAQASYVPGVGRYFGLVKDYMKVGILNNPVFYSRDILGHFDGLNGENILLIEIFSTERLATEPVSKCSLFSSSLSGQI